MGAVPAIAQDSKKVDPSTTAAPAPANQAQLTKTTEAFVRQLFAWGPNIKVTLGPFEQSAAPDYYTVPIEISFNDQKEKGEVYVSKEFADNLLHRAIGGKVVVRSPLDLLSNRELEAFELMGQGQTTEKIAALMNVSPKTVETYRARIKEKLGLKNITELVQRATQYVLENK